MQPVSLILDTDLGPDYDDVGAMAVMHALADSGYVDILATLSSNHDESVVPCIEVLNTYFNRPSIPVGAPKSEGGVTMTSGHKIKWTEALPDKYPHKTKKTSDAPDAVQVYRKVLSAQPDKSVVICTIGFFTNLKDLLHSEGDEYSPLSGKELVAMAIHKLSERSSKEFVAINCGAIPESLMESLLFGYEEGAFSGAKKNGQQGLLETANGGTLFLDEAGEMPYLMQAKILRTLQNNKIRRLGASKSIQLDVRIISASNKNLRKQVELGNFRKDLFYRLDVIPIFIPPLRERMEDVPLLIDFSSKTLKISIIPNFPSPMDC